MVRGVIMVRKVVVVYACQLQGCLITSVMLEHVKALCMACTQTRSEHPTLLKLHCLFNMASNVVEQSMFVTIMIVQCSLCCWLMQHLAEVINLLLFSALEAVILTADCKYTVHSVTYLHVHIQMHLHMSTPLLISK